MKTKAFVKRYGGLALDDYELAQLIADKVDATEPLFEAAVAYEKAQADFDSILNKVELERG